MKAIEVIKKIAEDEAKKLNIVEMGIVTSIFPHSDASDRITGMAQYIVNTFDIHPV